MLNASLQWLATHSWLLLLVAPVGIYAALCLFERNHETPVALDGSWRPPAMPMLDVHADALEERTSSGVWPADAETLPAVPVRTRGAA